MWIESTICKFSDTLPLGIWPQLTILPQTNQWHNSFLWPGQILNTFHLAAACQIEKGSCYPFGCLNKRTSRRMTALSSETDLVLFSAQTCQPLGRCMKKYVQRHAQYSFFSTHALQSFGFQFGGPHQLLGAHFLVQVAPLHCLPKRRHNFR